MQDLALPFSRKQLLELVDARGYSYDIFEHEPMFTVEDGEHMKADIPGVH